MYDDDVIKVGNFTVTVERDDQAECPFNDWDIGPNYGLDLSNHRDYKGGEFGEAAPVDVSEFLYWYANQNADSFTHDDSAEFVLFDKQYHWYCIFMYDHSGRTVSLAPFGDPWDSGTAGIAFIKKTDLIQGGFFGVKKSWPAIKREQAAHDLLESNVKVLDDYMQGNAYGYVIKDKDGDVVEAAWGFWGDCEYPFNEGKAAAVCLHRAERTRRLKRIKQCIKNHVPLFHRQKIIEVF